MNVFLIFIIAFLSLFVRKEHFGIMAFVTITYGLHGLISPSLSDLDYYLSAQAVDALILLYATTLKPDRFIWTVRGISFAFVVTHIIGLTFYALWIPSEYYNSILTGLYLVFIYTILTKGGGCALNGIIESFNRARMALLYLHGVSTIRFSRFNICKDKGVEEQ